MNTSLKVYLCSYYRSHGWGAFEEIYAICFANTESEALGLLLTDYPQTDTYYWSIVEQASSSLGVLEITGRTN